MKRSNLKNNMGLKMMFNLSGSEMLFYGGLAVMIAAILLTMVCVVVFILTGQKLKRVLEQEYGKQGK